MSLIESFLAKDNNYIEKQGAKLATSLTIENEYSNQSFLQTS